MTDNNEARGAPAVALRKCRVCGCTDDDCHQCIEKSGAPCYWVEQDLCSVCRDEMKPTKRGRQTGKIKQMKRND